jgi:acyl carrier protein
MNFEEFREKFQEQLADPPATPLTEKTAFKGIAGWDSMTALMVIDMIDSEFGKTITNEDIKNCNSLEDLFKLVESK